MVSELSLRGRTFNFNRGFFAGGSSDAGSTDGDNVLRRVPEAGVDARPLSLPPAIPLLVASLYFSILAVEMREVK